MEYYQKHNFISFPFQNVDSPHSFSVDFSAGNNCMSKLFSQPHFIVLRETVCCEKQQQLTHKAVLLEVITGAP